VVSGALLHPLVRAITRTPRAKNKIVCFMLLIGHNCRPRDNGSIYYFPFKLSLTASRASSISAPSPDNDTEQAVGRICAPSQHRFHGFDFVGG
jgi:hypothetical protein